jgi:pSer/pThr/pTyr-binding forkhead associated (FHA) protein
MLNAKLVVVGGNALQDEFELKLPAVIGRGADVDLAMADELISRRHAEIYENQGKLFVKDLGSRNGTFVNNRKILSNSPLEPEELLTLGTITFRAIYSPLESSQNGNDVSFSETVRLNFDRTERLPILAESTETLNMDTLGSMLASRETVEMEELKRHFRVDGANDDRFSGEKNHSPEPLNSKPACLSTKSLAIADSNQEQNLLGASNGLEENAFKVDAITRRHPK